MDDDDLISRLRAANPVTPAAEPIGTSASQRASLVEEILHMPTDTLNPPADARSRARRRTFQYGAAAALAAAAAVAVIAVSTHNDRDDQTTATTATTATTETPIPATTETPIATVPPTIAPATTPTPTTSPSLTPGGSASCVETYDRDAASGGWLIGELTKPADRLKFAALDFEVALSEIYEGALG